MNRTKKVAVVAVSIVMAGTMAVSFTACKKKPKTDETIKVMEYAEGTTITTSIGYQKNAETGIAFSTTTLPLKTATGDDVGASIKLPDGVTYQKGDLKPIWNAYKQALKINIKDNWTKEDDNLTACANQGLENFDLIGAGSLETIQKQINGGTLLNLNEYIDYMPNLRHFLDNNALAELGTLADTETGAIYYAPYYGGMNDVERINLFRKDYVSELLDYANLSEAATKHGGTVTFKYQADKKKEYKLGARKDNETYDGSQASITSYMGQTGSYVVETTDPASKDGSGTLFVKVDYDAALNAAKDTSTELGKAISDAAGKTYDGTSGNIVDLQNFAINAKSGEVKGEDLLKILRAYIDVTYKYADKENSKTWNQFYNTKVNGVTTKRSDIINSTYAAWDVDIYAAIGRCYVTCGNLLGEYQAQTSKYTTYGSRTWLFAPRTGFTNRTTRLTALIAELYGVRGGEKLQYLDSSGTFRQARFNESTWDAFMKFSAFHTEGLVPSFNTADAKNELTEPNSSCNSHYQADPYFQALSGNDFLAGQTKNKGLKGTEAPYVETTEGYNWTCVLTPVSRWLTTDESTVSDTGEITVATDGLLKDRPADKTTVMRFTESTLKIKPGGLVIPASTKNDPNRLGATLALVDYLYSNDGLIETTFGARSDSDNLTGNDTDGYTTTNNGWWYGEPVTKLTIKGKEVDISDMTMEDLYAKGVVETFDNGKQWTMTKEYQNQALVYKNKLYKTGVDDANSDYDVNKNGYTYNGAMTPYYTRAVRALCECKAVNGYKSNSIITNVNLNNKFLGQEGFGIVNNASAVQLYSGMAIPGADIFSKALGNHTIQTVRQEIDKNNVWYTCPPEITLPESSSAITLGYEDFSTLFKTSGSITNYFMLEVGWYGAKAGYTDFGTVQVQSSDLTTPKKIKEYLKGLAPQYEMLYNDTWAELYEYYVNKG